MENLSVSVAVCTYNGEEYIADQLKSILDQSRKVNEIVVCDDGSSDHTVEIISRLLEQSGCTYKLIQNYHNIGFRKNFEQAIGLTSGDIVFLSDQDDIWYNNKVEKILEAFEQDKNCLLVFSDAELVNRQLSKLPISLWESVYLKKHWKKCKDWKDLFLKGYYVTGAAMAIRRSLYEKAFPFSENWYHDGWLAIYAAEYGNIKALPEKLIRYRQHGNNQVGAEATAGDRIKKKQEVIKSNKFIQIKIHKDLWSRYEEFYNRERKNLDPSFELKIKEAVTVHKTLSGLPDLGIFKKISLIIKYVLTGKYQKYYKKGYGVMLGDLFFLVLH